MENTVTAKKKTLHVGPQTKTTANVRNRGYHKVSKTFIPKKAILEA